MGLVLTRYIDDSVIIDGNLLITISSVQGKKVRLHFTELRKAPEGHRIQIDRYEEYKKVIEGGVNERSKTNEN